MFVWGRQTDRQTDRETDIGSPSLTRSVQVVLQCHHPPPEALQLCDDFIQPALLDRPCVPPQPPHARVQVLGERLVVRPADVGHPTPTLAQVPLQLRPHIVKLPSLAVQQRWVQRRWTLLLLWLWCLVLLFFVGLCGLALLLPMSDLDDLAHALLEEIHGVVEQHVDEPTEHRVVRLPEGVEGLPVGLDLEELLKNLYDGVPHVELDVLTCRLRIDEEADQRGDQVPTQHRRALDFQGVVLVLQHAPDDGSSVAARVGIAEVTGRSYAEQACVDEQLQVQVVQDHYQPGLHALVYAVEEVLHQRHRQAAELR
mmetsp:Transcript_50439/g.126378  ORF Transcript_50439/g.126378 Transcript_50439/m.126378 type:complete len:312 (-) Transcript_50439:1816-2751(-)